MRDIGDRIRRYRLSRYAPPQDPVRRRLRWAWLLGGLWLAWVGAVSDHSLWRIWRLSRENAATRRQLDDAQREIARLDAFLNDPRARALKSEEKLRGDGMARPGERIYRIEGAPGDSARD